MSPTFLNWALAVLIVGFGVAGILMRDETYSWIAITLFGCQLCWAFSWWRKTR